MVKSRPWLAGTPKALSRKGVAHVGPDEVRRLPPLVTCVSMLRSVLRGTVQLRALIGAVDRADEVLVGTSTSTSCAYLVGTDGVIGPVSGAFRAILEMMVPPELFRSTLPVPS